MIIEIPGGTITNATSGATQSFIGSAYIASSVASLDFGNFTINSSGVFVVGFNGRNQTSSVTLSNIVIGGSTATIVPGSQKSPLTSNDYGAFAYLALSSGTYDVTVNLTGPATTSGNNVFGVAVWLVTNENSITPFSAENSNTVSATSVSLTHYESAGSVSLYTWMVLAGSLPATVTWSGATVDVTSTGIGGGANVFSAAHNSGITADIPSHTETVSTSTSETTQMNLATWR